MVGMVPLVDLLSCITLPPIQTSPYPLPPFLFIVFIRVALHFQKRMNFRKSSERGWGAGMCGAEYFPEGRGGAKERVNQLIQEIDKCAYLELLSRYL